MVKGTTIMFVGSFVLLAIVLLVPRIYLLQVAIPFVVLELSFALYVTKKNGMSTT